MLDVRLALVWRRPGIVRGVDAPFAAPEFVNWSGVPSGCFVHRMESPRRRDGKRRSQRSLTESDD